MEEKVKVGLFLKASTVEALRGLIQYKYQKYQKGLLSYEADMALQCWIAGHTSAQKTLDQPPPNPEPKVAMAFMAVKSWLLHNYYPTIDIGQQVPLKHIQEAIIEVRGSDERTVRKWLKLFERFHLIKPTYGTLWELL